MKGLASKGTKGSEHQAGALSGRTGAGAHERPFHRVPLSTGSQAAAFFGFDSRPPFSPHASPSFSPPGQAEAEEGRKANRESEVEVEAEGAGGNLREGATSLDQQARSSSGRSKTGAHESPSHGAPSPSVPHAPFSFGAGSPPPSSLSPHATSSLPLGQRAEEGKKADHGAWVGREMKGLASKGTKGSEHQAGALSGRTGAGAHERPFHRVPLSTGFQAPPFFRFVSPSSFSPHASPWVTFEQEYGGQRENMRRLDQRIDNMNARMAGIGHCLKVCLNAVRTLEQEKEAMNEVAKGLQAKMEQLEKTCEQLSERVGSQTHVLRLEEAKPGGVHEGQPSATTIDQEGRDDKKRRGSSGGLDLSSPRDVGERKGAQFRERGGWQHLSQSCWSVLKWVLKYLLLLSMSVVGLLVMFWACRQFQD